MVFKISDIADIINVSVKDPATSGITTFVGLEHYDIAEPVITRFGSTEMLSTSVKKFTKGDILMARRNVYLRRAGKVDFDGVTSGDSIVIRVKATNQVGVNSGLIQELLPFVLNTNAFWDYANTNSDGTMSKRLSPQMLLDYEFELPETDEQRILAEKLWAAYRLKQSYKKLLAAADEMVKSQFIEMFGAMGTTPVGQYIQDSYPGEWGVDDNDGTGIKVIRTTNFTNNGKLDLSNVVTRIIEEKKVNRKGIQKYDTILERSGGTADNPVGRVVLFEDDGVYLCNNFTQVLRFKDINPRFAFYALYYFYQTNKTAIRGMGNKTTGIQNLNMSKYLEIGIPNASEGQQNEFVSIAEQADKSKFVGSKSQFIEMFEGKGYQSAMIKSFADVTTGGTPSKSHPEYWGGNKPWVSAEDMKSKYVYDTCEKVTDAGYATCKILPVDSLMYVCRGSIGVMAINKIECATNQSICRATCHKGVCNVDFLYHALLYQRDSIKKIGTGTSFKSLNQSTFSELAIELPPYDEQIKFVSIAEQADKSKYNRQVA